MRMSTLQRVFPFLSWIHELKDKAALRADLIAGLTVALVLIPQSMAYAGLAGLPAVYGLYIAFIPVFVAALWGSSRQLGTGPVAVVSTMTATTLAQMIEPESVGFDVLEKEYRPLLKLVEQLIGVVPNCDPVLEIWPPGFRSYNLLVPNLLNLPASLVGQGAPKDLVGLRRATQPCCQLLPDPVELS